MDRDSILDLHKSNYGFIQIMEINNQIMEIHILNYAYPFVKSWRFINGIMEIHNQIEWWRLHKSFMNLHNLARMVDIHNSNMEIHNSIMKIHNFDYGHPWLIIDLLYLNHGYLRLFMEIHKWASISMIMDLHESNYGSIYGKPKAHKPYKYGYP